jgi:hypothetical protein
MANKAIRIGQFVGAPVTLEWLGTEKELRAVRTWQNGTSPARSEKIKIAARGASLCLEPVFDAAHGRRYLCFAYRNAEERAACFAALTGA